jgi:hypothetical protein
MARMRSATRELVERAASAEKDTLCQMEKATRAISDSWETLGKANALLKANREGWF